MLRNSTYKGTTTSGKGTVLKLRIGETQIQKLEQLQTQKGFLTVAAAARYCIYNFTEGKK